MRPRLVRFRKPNCIRYGSTMSSSVSRSSPSIAAIVSRPDRPALVLFVDGRQETPVQTVQAQFVHFQVPQLNVGGLAGDDVAGVQLRVVADALEHPVGDTGRTTRAARDFVRSLRGNGNAQNVGRAAHDGIQLVHTVQFELMVNAEAVAHRARRCCPPAWSRPQA